MTIKVLFQSEDYLVAYKPSGVATVPLKAKAGGTFLDEIASLYPEVLAVTGRNPWEGGVIHRLDTPTSGLVLLARNQASYNWAVYLQNIDGIAKKYRATYCSSRDIDEGFEPFPYGNIVSTGGVISSRFRAFGPGAKSVRPTLYNPRFKDGKTYTTEVLPLDDSSVICTLTRGFRHQVRAHMAWAGYPLVGDTLYGGIESPRFGLEAIEISFMSRDGKEIIVSSLE